MSMHAGAAAHLEVQELLAERRVRPCARRQQVPQRKLTAAALRDGVVEIVPEQLALVRLQRLACGRIGSGARVVC